MQPKHVDIIKLVSPINGLLTTKKGKVFVMMRKNTAVLFAFLSVFAIVANADANRRRAVGNPDAALKANILAIENSIISTYGNTSFDWVYEQMVVNGDHSSAGNILVIPIVQAEAYTVKYELEARDPQYIASALDRLELATKLYPYWGHGWLSPSVVNSLVLAMNRVRQDAGSDPLFAGRIAADWQAVLEVLREEADGILGQTLPLAPLDSSATGDTKAEEDAWIASPLSAAAVFLPNDPHAADWEAKAKEVAYAAITRPSDSPYSPTSVKTTTVAEDFSLNNHGFPNNAYYTAATIELLQQAALPYRVAGRSVPDEFGHNVSGLYAKYQTYISTENGHPYWNVACDSGDPTDLPVVMGDGSEYRYAAQKAVSGYLWQRITVQSTIADGTDLWTAIQNHKVAWRYFVNVFLQHWPAPTSR